MSQAMTATQETGAARLAQVRKASMGAVVMLVIQFILGIIENLYGNVTPGKSIGVFSNGWLIAHEIMAIALLGAATGLVARSFGSGNSLAKRTSVTGLAAIVLAVIAGIGFLPKGGNSASLGMSLAFAVALLSYVINILRLAPGPAASSAG